MSTEIKKLVLDVLKPHNPSLPYLANQIIKIQGVYEVNIVSIEIDKETESIKVTIDGKDLDFENIKEKFEEYNCAIHSIDQVIAGRVIEEITTSEK